MSSYQKICQLCSKLGPHPDAHIFPKSLYRGERGVSFIAFEAAGRQPTRRSQSGIYDNQLWCQTCETMSAKLDDHVSHFLLNPVEYLESIQRISFDEPYNHYRMASIDPHKLHSFVLSVLWRASASTRLEVKKFTLGIYQEEIKEILRSSTLIRNRFPFILRYEKNPLMRSGFICPSRYKFDGVNFVRFHGSGFAFDIKIGKGLLPTCLLPFTNAHNKPVTVLNYSLLETREGRALAQGARRSHALRQRRG